MKVSFENDFRRYSNNLERFAYQLTSDFQNAQDLFQETAFKAFKNQEKFRENTNMLGWLRTIMRNTFINDYRKRRKAALISDPNEYHLSNVVDEVKAGPEGLLKHKELITLIKKLEPKYRVPLSLYVQGYSYKEMAKLLSVPLGTLKSRIFFGRKQLKTWLKAQEAI